MSNEASAKHPKKGKNKLSVKLTVLKSKIESGKWGYSSDPMYEGAKVNFVTRGESGQLNTAPSRL